MLDDEDIKPFIKLDLNNLGSLKETLLEHNVHNYTLNLYEKIVLKFYYNYKLFIFHRVHLQNNIMLLELIDVEPVKQHANIYLL